MHAITVIIPTLNAAPFLADLIRAIHHQSVKVREIIVIDSSSEDETRQIAAREQCTVLTIPRSEFNHGRTRNIAALQAQGDILVFMTQDALPANNSFLLELVRPIYTRTATATYGRQIPYESSRLTEQFARRCNYPDTDVIRTHADIDQLGIKAIFFSNVASALLKDAFFSTGMFDEHVIMNEDMLFCAKLLQEGHAIAYCSKAMVFHSHNYSLLQHMSRYFDIGAFFANNVDHKIFNIHSTGMQFTKNMLRHIWKSKQYTEFPFFFLETAAKFIGFHLGIRERFLPLSLKQKFSMHSNYWKN